jgi:hypothetical protein
MAGDHVRVGVRLAGRPEDLAEWLADATAFEAAGVEALVVELDPDARLDPYALTAALAVLTHRCLLVTSPVPGADQSRTLTTLAQLSRGRLRILDADGAVADRTEVALLRPASGDPAGAEDQLRWCPAPAPESRAAWRSTLDEAIANGHDGIIVAAGPRLLDILRNPDEPGERLDLHLAQG